MVVTTLWCLAAVLFDELFAFFKNFDDLNFFSLAIS
jgi:hypothetical protein